MSLHCVIEIFKHKTRSRIRGVYHLLRFYGEQRNKIYLLTKLGWPVMRLISGSTWIVAVSGERSLNAGILLWLIHIHLIGFTQHLRKTILSNLLSVPSYAKCIIISLFITSRSNLIAIGSLPSWWFFGLQHCGSCRISLICWLGCCAWKNARQKIDNLSRITTVVLVVFVWRFRSVQAVIRIPWTAFAFDAFCIVTARGDFGVGS